MLTSLEFLWCLGFYLNEKYIYCTLCFNNNKYIRIGKKNIEKNVLKV